MPKEKKNRSSRLHQSGRPFVENSCEFNAVANRDYRWDGRFLYADRARQTYCQPSCKSRTKTTFLENYTRFTHFKTAEASEKLEYQRCKRCKKMSPQKRSIVLEIIILELMKEIKGKKPTIAQINEIAKKNNVDISLWHMHRKFHDDANFTMGYLVKSYQLKSGKFKLKGYLQLVVLTFHGC